MTKPRTRVLGTFTLAMITMAAIVSLRNLPLNAELGFSSVFFLCLAALIFFIPTALVIAELAAAWPRAGGCYVWVGEAFGKPLAFVTLWLSWMASVAWFPTILAFTATMLAHILTPIFPGLESSPLFIMLCMLAIFWITTFSNFCGIEFSGFLISGGVLIGTLIPGLLIIILGIAWVFNGNPSQIPLSINSLIPDCKLDNLILFSGLVLGLAGVELAAYHVREAKDPQHSYPRALLLASGLILSVYILGTLAIAIVVPQQDLSLASGLVQAFAVFFTQVGLPWMVPLMAAFLLCGALAGINAWVVGPAKGMLIVAQDGFLPNWLQRANKHGVPTALLVMQAIVGSLLALLFMYIRNNNTSIWILIALSAQFTCVVYVLIFCAALKLRLSQPYVARPFRVKAIWAVAACGIVACVFSFAIVYVPHVKLVSIEYASYSFLLMMSFLVLLLPAIMLIYFRDRSDAAKFNSKNT
jgi:amino acid transporter